MWSRSLVLAALLCLSLAHIHDKYTGYSVYTVWPEDESQLDSINRLVEELSLDVWQKGSPQGHPARVMLSPDQKTQVLATLDRNEISHEMEIADVASQLKKEDAELHSYRSSRTNRKAFEDYPRYAEVNAYMADLAARHPSVVTLETIGQSYEGRDINYLKLSTSNFADSSKPVIFLDATIHAREWVTAPTVLYGLHRLLDEPTDDDRWILDNLDWIILPIVNPDGYEYSHEHDRMWRRTRSLNRFVTTECLGVDGNRNFDVMWNTTGVSQDPCCQTYPGGEPFSEPETRYVRDLIHEHIERMYFYMNIHSHGNYVLYPFGDGRNPPEAEKVHFVGAAMGAEMDARKLEQAGYYLVGNSARMLYGTSGSAQDYAAQEGVPLAYTLELPGLGYQFQVPPTFINQINMETWHGLAKAAKLTRMLWDIRNR